MKKISIDKRNKEKNLEFGINICAIMSSFYFGSRGDDIAGVASF